MTNPRNYKLSDIKKLFAFSGNQCAEPNCTRKMISDDGNVVLGEICHISAAKPNGPRYDEKMSDDDRRSYDNLILLCDEHHTTIDNKTMVDNYPTSLLKEWKQDDEVINKNSKFNVSNKVARKALNELIENKLKIISYSILYNIETFLKYIYYFFRKPSSFYVHNKILFLEATVFIFLSIIISSFLDYPFFSSASAMVREEDVWTILLETRSDREFYSIKGFVLGSVEFFRILLNVLSWSISFLLLSRIFFPIVVIEKKPRRFLKDILVPYSIYLVGISFITSILFLSSSNELFSNQIFILILIVSIILFLILFSRWLITIKNYLRTSFIKSIGLIILNSFIAFIINVFLTLIIPENAFYLKDSQLGAANDFNNLADKSLESQNYERAIHYSKEALKTSPENLRADATIIEAKRMSFSEHYEHITDFFVYNDSIKTKDKGVLSQDVKILTENLEDFKSAIEKFSQKYNDVPSAQLYASQIFADFGLCDNVIGLVIKVFNDDKSNPSEKVEAASILKNLTENQSIDSRNSKFSDYIDNTIWLANKESYLDRLGFALRLSISRSNDNLNMILEGYNLSDTMNILKPKEAVSLYLFGIISVPYECNQELRIDTKIQHISDLINSEE